MTFDFTKIGSINLKFNNQSWNSKTHNILVTRDPTSELGISIKMIEITDDKMLTDLSLANDVLKKFRISE